VPSACEGAYAGSISTVASMANKDLGASGSLYSCFEILVDTDPVDWMKAARKAIPGLCPKEVR